jgi:hypothetical protein
MIVDHKAILVAALALACRDPSMPVPATSVTPPPGTNPPPAQADSSSEPPKANAAAESASSGARPKTSAAGRHLTEGELVAVLIESNFQNSNSELAKEKLASIGAPRESRPIDAALEIRADAAETHFLVAYSRYSSGPWQFSYARATREAPDASAAMARYRGIEAHLSKRFGKPAWTQDSVGPPPIKGWHVGDGALEVSLLQRNDESGKTLLEVTLAEPEGEAD